MITRVQAYTARPSVPNNNRKATPVFGMNMDTRSIGIFRNAIEQGLMGHKEVTALTKIVKMDKTHNDFLSAARYNVVAGFLTIVKSDLPKGASNRLVDDVADDRKSDEAMMSGLLRRDDLFDAVKRTIRKLHPETAEESIASLERPVEEIGTPMERFNKLAKEHAIYFEDKDLDVRIFHT